jgi:hypothetical protein
LGPERYLGRPGTSIHLNAIPFSHNTPPSTSSFPPFHPRPTNTNLLLPSHSYFSTSAAPSRSSSNPAPPAPSPTSSPPATSMKSPTRPPAPYPRP